MNSEDGPRDWAEDECANSVTVNGCSDKEPYYEVPWCEGPAGPYWFTEHWCSECVEEMPMFSIEDGEVVADLSDYDKTEYDEVRASEIEDGNIEK